MIPFLNEGLNMATIMDVAKLSGFSKVTVSSVINKTIL
jgi:hypothetical protein